MKSIVLLCLLTIGLVINAFCQKSTIDLTFTAINNNQYVAIDSILIINLTQEVDTVLYSPDTILSLEYNTGVFDNLVGETNLFISQNYPNPFKDKTTINIYMNATDRLNISIRDILGREVAQYSNTLIIGKHTFTFYPAKEMYYILYAETNHRTQFIKMINLNSNERTFCKFDYVGVDLTFEKFKSGKDFSYFGFNSGDLLKFTAFAKTINAINGSSIIEDSPASNKTYVFNITEGVPCPDIPFVTYDNQVYQTIQIGDQCWFKKNLNIGTAIYGDENMEDNGIIEKYCYGNLVSNCDIYGGLYQWDEMMLYTTEEGVQGICPQGWHIPTDNEWFVLENYLDPTITEPLIFGWRGINAGTQLKVGGSSGFNALLEGRREFNSGIFNFFGTSHFWSSTQFLDNVIYRRLEIDQTGIAKLDCVNTYGFPVRCIRDIIYDPPQPSNPVPENESTGVDTDITLFWSCGSAPTDSLLFQVYFGTSSNPPVVASFIQDTSYYPGILDSNSIYYWRVTVYNTEGDSTNGNIWSFQTISSILCNTPLVDIRDGQNYSTVLIGNQCWMAENLNLGTMINGYQSQTNNEIFEKYCFNNSPDSCDNYGGLYQWDEMMLYENLQGIQGICPEGWHIPTDNEWFVLENFLDPTINDPNAFGWRGINAGTELKVGGASGFNALLEGRREYYPGIFNFFGTSFFWSSTEILDEAIYRRLEEDNSGIGRMKCSEYYGFPVRCIKD